MRIHRIFVAAGLAFSLMSGSMLADSHLNRAISARQSMMSLITFNMGTLGGMAQGKIDYDAVAAKNAADNLASLTGLHQDGMWPAGSDSFDLQGKTRAKPKIWDNFDDFLVKFEAANAAALVMADAAGVDLDSLRGAIGGLGQTCGACHKAYRAPKG